MPAVFNRFFYSSQPYQIYLNRIPLPQNPLAEHLPLSHPFVAQEVLPYFHSSNETADTSLMLKPEAVKRKGKN